MTWSVVVVAKGMWPVTEKCLDSLLATTKPGQIQTIEYIDNGTPPGEDSWKRFLEYYPKRLDQVTWMTRECEATSLPKLWNDAVSMVAGGNVLLLNNDIEFRGPGWLDVFEQALEEPGVGVTGVVGMSWRNTPFIQGAVFAFKEATYRLIGPFDEQFEFTCEEVDWCKRAAQVGLGIKSNEWLREQNIVYHHEGATRNYYKEDIKHYQYLAHLSRLRWCYKWTYPDIHIHD